MHATERLNALAAELDNIAESLADAAMDVLRSALEESRPAAAEAAKKTERIINRARSSVEKAARLSRQAGGADDEAGL
ncbi:MAG: hypothetical protein ACYCSF_10270 [Acidimicrobiales bacterium]